jgi:hypothetical protein
MMEERYHATAQNWFYPDMSNVNKNVTLEAKHISPPTYFKAVHRNETKCNKIMEVREIDLLGIVTCAVGK